MEGGVVTSGSVCLCHLLFLRGLFISRERDVGRSFEELFPELCNCVSGTERWMTMQRWTDFGTLPSIARMLGILLHNRKDAGCHDAMGLAEVMVDFCICNEWVFFYLRQVALL